MVAEVGEWFSSPWPYMMSSGTSSSRKWPPPSSSLLRLS